MLGDKTQVYHSRAKPSKNMFFFRNISWSTLSGLVLLLLESRTLAHSLNSRSTSTLVAAGVRNLNKITFLDLLIAASISHATHLQATFTRDFLISEPAAAASLACQKLKRKERVNKSKIFQDLRKCTSSY